MSSGRLIEAAKRTDMSLSAELSTPPGWDTHYNQALGHPAPFLKVKIDPGSREFQVLQDFIGPGACQIKNIHRVVNPKLWRRFLATRKEIICEKSFNGGVLRSLGMGDGELTKRAKSQLNPHFPAYADNVALLFHCTRGGSVDAILSEGLDDRLAHGGSYGRGIYFADDPAKSLAYDGTGGTLFIFAVYLGDLCPAPGGTITREPAKEDTHKRSQMDLFFDSVLGGHDGYNEYVIFSRHQCCPLYMVSCQSTGQAGSGPYDFTIRRKPPHFAWIANASVSDHRWPFLAKIVFQEMYPPTPQPVTTTDIPLTKWTPPEKTIQDYLSEFILMGFTNDEENKVILSRFNYNFLLALDHLEEYGYDNGAHGGSSGPSFQDDSTLAEVNSNIDEEEQLQLAIANSLLDSHRFKETLGQRNRSGQVATRVATAKQEEVCCGCTRSTNLKVLKCGHKLCNWCTQVLQKSGSTMSGQRHVFLKCPFCNVCDGVEIGTCPNGIMAVTKRSQSAEGFEGYPSICIRYQISQGPYLIHRTAFLPDTPEGNEVLGLLKTAWDRRLCFAVNPSSTMMIGEQTIPVWNISLKTALNGGVWTNAYPDPMYLKRVKEELKELGVQ